MTRSIDVEIKLDPQRNQQVGRFLREQPLLPQWSLRLHSAHNARTRQSHPDVLVTSARALSPGASGAVVLIADETDAMDLSTLVGAPGVRAVVLSHDPLQALASGIAAAGMRGVWLSEAASALLGLGYGAVPVVDGASLTPVEREVLLLLARGMTNNEIARARHVELSTVKFHVANLRLKTGATNRHELMIRAHHLAGIGGA